MVFVDKTKTITYDTEVSPPTIIDQSTNNNHNVCSKCHTQIMKKLWPSWASDNALSPDTFQIKPINILTTPFLDASN